MLKETQPGKLFLADEKGELLERDGGGLFPVAFKPAVLFYLSRIATALERIAEEHSK